jgi:hypothetical protein
MEDAEEEQVELLVPSTTRACQQRFEAAERITPERIPKSPTDQEQMLSTPPSHGHFPSTQARIEGRFAKEGRATCRVLYRESGVAL